MADDWTFADAWVLAAIHGVGDAGDGLAKVIAAADGVNHAMLGEEEFAGACARLMAAGLVDADADADRYRLTGSGRRLWQRRMRRRGLFGWIKAIPPALRGLGEPPPAQPLPLPVGAFDRAVRQYLRDAHRRGRAR